MNCINCGKDVVDEKLAPLCAYCRLAAPIPKDDQSLDGTSRIAWEKVAEIEKEQKAYVRKKRREEREDTWTTRSQPS